MKFYDCATAPSPRRVRIFIAEKGMDIPVVEVDLRNAEQLSPEFKAVNPRCTVPVLELDDGTILADIFGICGYLEELQPEPDLMGKDAVERALVTQWSRYMEEDGATSIRDALRNRAKGLKGRALTGPVDYEQIPELAERGRLRTERFLVDLDARLGKSEYVALPRFTMADITAFVAVEFAKWVKVEAQEGQTNLKRWHDAVAARPSSKL